MFEIGEYCIDHTQTTCTPVQTCTHMNTHTHMHAESLTISFEAAIELEDAVSRKQACYAKLNKACRANRHTTTIVTIDVSSWGLLHMAEFKQLNN